MINISQFRELIIIPALSRLHMYSKDAEELLVFTCAAESDGGTYLHQIKGPASGIYQCEPNTHHDIWQNYIIYRSNITAILALNFDVPRIPTISRLIYDLHYATAICRLHYARVKAKIPSKDNIDDIWEYYKKHYNTESGKATKEKSIAAYYRFAKLPLPK